MLPSLVYWVWMGWSSSCTAVHLCTVMVYFGPVIKPVLLTHQCSGFHSFLVFFFHYSAYLSKLERDITGAVDPNWPKGHFLGYAIMLCNKSSGKGGGVGVFWLWLSFSQATITCPEALFFRNWMDIGLPTTSEWISDFNVLLAHAAALLLHLNSGVASFCSSNSLLCPTGRVLSCWPVNPWHLGTLKDTVLNITLHVFLLTLGILDKEDRLWHFYSF